MRQKPVIATHESVSTHGVEAVVSRGNWFGGTAARRIDELSAYPARRAYIRILPILRGFKPSRFEREVIMTDQFESLMNQAASLGSLGAVARQQGDEVAADQYFRDALGLARDAANHASGGGSNTARLDTLRIAARFALDCGEVMEARRLMDEAFAAEPSTKFANDWTQLGDVASWPVTWLIAAVRRDPPDVEALDALANR